MIALFVDTGAFVAKEISGDQFHATARQSWSEVEQRGYRLQSPQTIGLSPNSGIGTTKDTEKHSIRNSQDVVVLLVEHLLQVQPGGGGAMCGFAQRQAGRLVEKHGEFVETLAAMRGADRRTR